MSVATAPAQTPLAPHGAVMIVAACALREQRPRWMQGEALIIGGGIVFPLAILSALFAYTASRNYSRAAAEPAAVRIAIVGEMWWWRVHYLDANGQVDFATANELHLPVDRTVEISLTSADVIHSFWLPGLSGMLDMIPGRVNTLRLTPRKTGSLRGQCTEFCGMQHARMTFRAQVREAAAFDRWIEAQRAHAGAPESALAAHGKQLFAAHCAACHTVRGTDAAGVLGPDLTHVGTRTALAAGMLPNNVGTIGAWIASSQHLKPGNRMPSFERFTPIELNALARYVESLR
jgi:cytochrome c oxidase subunit II